MSDAPPRPWSRLDSLAVVALTLGSVGLLGRAATALGPTALEPAALARAAEVAARHAPGAPLASVTLVERLAGWLAGAPDASLARFRIGAVLLSATTPAVVYTLGRGLGRELALVAALLALLVPRGLVDGATLGGEGPVAALVWAGLLAHLSSRGRPWRAALGGALLALATTASWGVLLVAPALLAHQALARPPVGRARVAAPTALVAMLVCLPLAFALARPGLRGDAIGELLVTAASPSIAAGLWAGSEPLPDTIPRFHTLVSLLLALPSATTLLAAAGLARWWRDERGPSVVSLAVSVLGAVTLWPLVAPPGLGRFPGHAGLLWPAAALLAAYGLAAVDRTLRSRWGPEGHPGRRWVIGAVVLGPAFLSCVIAPVTLSAGVSWVSGGPWRAAHHGPAPLHDGSAVGALVPSIEAAARSGAGRPVRVWSPDVSPEVWSALCRHGGLRAEVRPVDDLAAADLLVLTGAAVSPDGATRLAQATRDGQPIVTLYRRSPRSL